MSHVKPKKKTAKRKYRKPLGYDFTVLFIVLILVLFGVVMIFSSSYYYTMTTERFHNDMFYFLKRQSLWAVLGIVAMVGMMHIPYTLWRRFAKLAYWLSNLFLLALPFVGTEAGGQKRWLGIGSLSFQPSEFTKIAVILFLSSYVIEHRKELANLKGFFKACCVLLLPVAVVVALILLKKPTIPTFVAGIAVGAVLAMVFQGESLKDILTVMYSGFSVESGSDVVNSMLNRGGFTSMLSTIGLLIAAGIFGAPLRTAGVVDVLLAFVRRVAKSSRTMSLGVLLLHAVFFTITGAYYVSYPVVGGMVKDLYPEYGLDRKNLMRTLLDTGTGLAPLVSWSTTGSYTATTLGIGNLAFLPYAPMLWLSIVFSVIYAVTGIGTARVKEEN